MYKQHTKINTNKAKIKWKTFKLENYSGVNWMKNLPTQMSRMPMSRKWIKGCENIACWHFISVHRKSDMCVFNASCM